MPKPPHTRTRSTKSHKFSGRYRLVLQDGTVWTDDELSAELTGRQTTVSEGHHWPPPKGEAFSDRGGPFYTTKTYVRGKPGHMDERVYNRWGDYYRYNGSLFIHPREMHSGDEPYFPPDTSSSDDALRALGTTAIAQCKPTNSNSDVATAIGELFKDGLPTLTSANSWQGRIEAARRAGGDYLSTQFAFVPLVDEITKFGESIRESDRIISQYERDAGKMVRRRYNFSPEHESTTLTFPNFQAHFAGQLGWFAGASAEKLELVVETTKSRSFSGAFTYAMPYGLESRNGISKLASDADTLFGALPTPELLWNLAPWSWAVDWFSNTGDVISNLSDFATNGLVLRYGYISEHTVSSYTYKATGSGFKPEFPQSVPELSLIRETKKRIPASPYGFGIGWDEFSTFQLSILSALGISRLR